MAGFEARLSSIRILMSSKNFVADALYHFELQKAMRQRIAGEHQFQ